MSISRPKATLQEAIDLYKKTKEALNNQSVLPSSKVKILKRIKRILQECGDQEAKAILDSISPTSQTIPGLDKLIEEELKGVHAIPEKKEKEPRDRILGIDIYLFNMFSNLKYDRKNIGVLSPQKLLEKWKTEGEFSEGKPDGYHQGAGLEAYLKVMQQHENNGDWKNHAEKLFTLFKNDNFGIFSILNYLAFYEKQHARTQTPIHDACLFELPRDLENWDGLMIWQRLAQICKYEKWFMDFLPLARKIEEDPYFIEWINKRLSLYDKNKDSAEKIKEELLPILEQAKANFVYSPELTKKNKNAAILFLKHNIPQESFEKYLQLKPTDDFKLIPRVHLNVYFSLEDKQKTKPIIEQVELQRVGPESEPLSVPPTKPFAQATPSLSSQSIFSLDDVKELKTKKQAYTIERLDSDNPEAAILGYLTGCCQSVGSVGTTCVEYGITQKNSGFYVIRKDGEIVAQTWAWRVDDTLIFDSIEGNEAIFGAEKKHLLSALFKGLADQIVDKTEVGIKQVLVGTGGRTPEFCGLDLPKNKTVKLKGYHGYSDAKQQRHLTITFDYVCTILGISKGIFQKSISEEDVLKAAEKIKTVDQWLALLYYFKVDRVDHPQWPRLLNTLAFLITSESSLSDFKRAVEYLNLQQRQAVGESRVIQKKVAEMMNNSPAGAGLLINTLNSAGCQIFHESGAVEAKLSAIIESEDDFQSIILFCRDQAQHQIICESKVIQTRLAEVIHTVRDFLKLKRHLGHEQFETLRKSEIIQQRIVDLIKTPKDLVDFGDKLDRFESIQKKLPEIINTENDFYIVMRYLAPPQRQALFTSEIMQRKLPEMIKTVYDFKSVMRSLAPAQRQELFTSEIMQRKLPELIKTADDFMKIIFDIELEQRQIFFESETIQMKLAQIFKTVEDFRYLIEKLLSSEQRQIVFESKAIQTILANVIKRKSDFRLIKSPPFEVAQDRVLYASEAIQIKLSTMIETMADFLDILPKGAELAAERKVFLASKAIQPKLIEVIRAEKDFLRLVPFLTEAELRIVSKLLSDELKAKLLSSLLKDSFKQLADADQKNCRYKSELNLLGNAEICSLPSMIEIVRNLESKSCGALANVLLESKSYFNYDAFLRPPDPVPSMLAFILAIQGENELIVSQYCKHSSETHTSIPQEIITFAREKASTNKIAEKLLEWTGDKKPNLDV